MLYINIKASTTNHSFCLFASTLSLFGLRLPINGVMDLDQLAHGASRRHNVDQSLCLKGPDALQHPVDVYDDGGGGA